MNTAEIIQAEAEYVLQTYIRPSIVFTHGDGLKLVDSEGNEYLDFSSGIAVTALGHSDSELTQAIAEQAARLTHISNLYHSEPQVQLAKFLVENSFADKVYFCNSGAEANEAAIKFAKKYANTSASLSINLQSPISQSHNPPSSPAPQPPIPNIVAFTGGFHGRTAGALSVTYKEKYRAPFEPLVPGATFATYNDLDSAKATINAQTCAVIVEPIQGEGGVNPASQGFLQGLRELCNQNDALLIFDEVQCGLGRTGKLWGYELYDVTPDMMTLAKPLAGGLPIGATLVTQAVADVMKPGDHGSTFAAGPLVCTAANVVCQRVNTPQFLEQVTHHGEYLQHRLKTLESEQIVDVRGAGLLVAADLNTAVSPIINKAREKGLLVISAGENTLRFAPALTVTKDEIDTAVSILEQCLE